MCVSAGVRVCGMTCAHARLFYIREVECVPRRRHSQSNSSTDPLIVYLSIFIFHYALNCGIRVNWRLPSPVMGNETSQQEHGNPVLTCEIPSRHSQTTASLPDSLPLCSRQDSFIQRQESLLSETDFTDSSENSIFSRRRQLPGNTINSSTTTIPTIPASNATSSSEKSSILDVLVKRIGTSVGIQQQTSSSDDDQTGGARNLTSTASLQDSACEFLEASQNLTDEEKAKIKNVLNRVKLVENREAKRIS